MIRIGPAGWSYPDSPGHVYPAGVPSRFDALGFLATYFDAIEVNSTFYRPQDWWLLVLLAFAGPYVPWLVRRRPSDGPHPLGTAAIWDGAPAGTTAT